MENKLSPKDFFEDNIKEILNKVERTILRKNTEYSKNTDVFANFRPLTLVDDKGEKISCGINEKQILWGYLQKHLFSLYKMCQSGNYSVPQWSEKITDSIAYLSILMALVLDEEYK